VLKAVITFPIFFLALYGTGEFVRGLLLGKAPFSAGRAGRALGFGLLVHGILMTVLGFIGLFTPTVAAVITAIPVLLFAKYWWNDLRSFFSKNVWGSLRTLHIIELIILLILIAFLTVRGFNALAPNISWDATSHHYLVPSVWLESGRVSDLPSVIFSYYPSLVELGMGGAMALGTDYLSNLYGWLYGLLSILVLIGICTRHASILFRNSGQPDNIGRFAGLSAAVLFTMFPGVGVQTSGGYVDLPLACWAILTIDLLLELRQNPRFPVLVGSALFCGAVLATKHLGLILYPAAFIILAWILFTTGKNKFSTSGKWGYILIFGAISLAVVLPWYIRSIVLTGNPFYPFGILGLPTPPQPPFTSASWIRPDYHRSILGLITYWLHLGFDGSVGAALGRNYSMALPVLFPLVILIPKLKNDGRIVAVLSLLSVLAIYVLFPIETRYHLPFIAPLSLTFGMLLAVFFSSPGSKLPMLLLFAGTAVAILFIGLIRVDEALTLLVYYLVAAALIGLMLTKKPDPARLLATSLILVLLVGSAVRDIRKEDTTELEKRWKVVLNLEYEDAYMNAMSPRNYGAILHINNQMDWENMKVLALEPRLYRLKADWVTWFGLGEETVPTTPEENVAIWYKGGFTHVLLGDDVGLKALMYYNIVHLYDGVSETRWDIPGASPEELVEYLEEHPEEDKVHFLLQELWFNVIGNPMRSPRSRHFREDWLLREISKEQYQTETVDGIRYYTASRLEILTDPERLAQYAFVRDFQELVQSGGLKVVYDDELTFLFECDYEEYLRTHPDVDLELLGLE